MSILFTALLALALHLVLGWAWTLGAGVAAGLWAGQRGWLIGAAGVALEWAALVVYNVVVAPEAITRMARTMGEVMGNLPGFVTVLATVLIGALLGALGGYLGGQIRRLARSFQRQPARQSRGGGPGAA